MGTTTTLSALRTGHVGLNVTDLSRSAQFYGAVLGLQVLSEGSDGDREWAFLGRDGALMITLWRQSEGRFATGVPGLHHLSFEVGSLDEVRAVRETLTALDAEFQYDGVVPHAEGADSGGIFFTDPDGIRLEVFTASGVSAEARAAVGESPACGFF